ncbi:MAG: HI0074 family nucleotidyltransferase substrate-binding subunit [bacterium]
MTTKLLLDDYAQALARLHEVVSIPAVDDLDRAGCIQYFEFCFELAWKTIKVAGESQGLSGLVSPRACLSQAFTMGWIQSEELWLEMLDARNRMSHTYKHQDALTVYKRLGDFLPEMEKLLIALRSAPGATL